jgi:hypothetical protein
MPDGKRIDPFKPNQPTIPGVSSKPKTASSAKPDAAAAPGSAPKDKYEKGLPTGIVLALAGVLFLVIVGLWWSRRAPAEQAASTPAADTSATNPAPAKPLENLPLGPGAIATVEELAKPWASKRFLFKNFTTNDTAPAVVVHLPDGVYWGFSVREPFGTCEIEYVTDLKKLQTEYNFRATHPMVGDPCNHAVFDLMKYGSGPNGLVRGEIVSGAAVRPPLAIEMRAQDGKVVAVRME